MATFGRVAFCQKVGLPPLRRRRCLLSTLRAADEHTLAGKEGRRDGRKEEGRKEGRKEGGRKEGRKEGRREQVCIADRTAPEPQNRREEPSGMANCGGNNYVSDDESLRIIFQRLTQ